MHVADGESIRRTLWREVTEADHPRELLTALRRFLVPGGRVRETPLLSTYARVRLQSPDAPRRRQASHGTTFEIVDQVSDVVAETVSDVIDVPPRFTEPPVSDPSAYRPQ